MTSPGGAPSGRTPSGRTPRRTSAAIPPLPDRTTLSGPQRVATALAGLLLALLGGAGLLTSRLSGDAPGPLPTVALAVVAVGLALVLLAARGRTFAWLPARRPALLPQVVLVVAVVTLVAIGRGAAAVRDDAAGMVVGWGTVVVAALLVFVSLVRRWVPGLGASPGR